jgi:hypothetical protein
LNRSTSASGTTTVGHLLTGLMMAVLDQGADDLGRGGQLVLELQPGEAALVGAAHLGADFVDVDERRHVALALLVDLRWGKGDVSHVRRGQRRFL